MVVDDENELGSTRSRAPEFGLVFLELFVMNSWKATSRGSGRDCTSSNGPKNRKKQANAVVVATRRMLKASEGERRQTFKDLLWCETKKKREFRNLSFATRWP